MSASNSPLNADKQSFFPAPATLATALPTRPLASPHRCSFSRVSSGDFPPTRPASSRMAAIGPLSGIRRWPSTRPASYSARKWRLSCIMSLCLRIAVMHEEWARCRWIGSGTRWREHYDHVVWWIFGPKTCIYLMVEYTPTCITDHKMCPVSVR